MCNYSFPGNLSAGATSPAVATLANGGAIKPKWCFSAACDISGLRAARFDIVRMIDGTSLHADPFVLALSARRSFGILRAGTFRLGRFSWRLAYIDPRFFLAFVDRPRDDIFCLLQIEQPGPRPISFLNLLIEVVKFHDPVVDN